MRVLVVFLVLGLAGAAPAAAQSSLGVSTAAAYVGGESGAGNTLRAGLATDVAITGHHGLQLGLGYADFGTRRMGVLDGHLYLATQSDRKYGLFGSYGDFDTISAYTFQGGIEGMISGGPAIFEAQAGLGLHQPGDADFIFARAAVSVALGEALSLTADAMVAQIDEIAIDGTIYDVGLLASHALPGTIFRVDARFSAFGLSGVADDASVSLGLTATLGGSGRTSPPVDERHFTRRDAIDVLARLGRVGPGGQLF